MSYKSKGTEVDQVIFFNSGVLTISGGYNIDVSDITITNQVTVNKLRTLNSIKPRALRRSTLEASVSCTVQGGWSDLDRAFFDSTSSASGGNVLQVSDGQATISGDVLLTVSADKIHDTTVTSGEYQFILKDPVISNDGSSLGTEAYGNKTLEIQCSEILLYEPTAIKNTAGA